MTSYRLVVRNSRCRIKQRFPLEDGLTPSQMKEIYIDQFKKNQTREADQATTLIGPHRDDLIFI